MIDDGSLERLAEHLRYASEHKFTGNIQINFYQGGISNIIKQSTPIKETLELRVVRIV